MQFALTTPIPPRLLLFAGGLALSALLPPSQRFVLPGALVLLALAFCLRKSRLFVPALGLALAVTGFAAGGLRTAEMAKGPLFQRVASSEAPVARWVRGELLSSVSNPDGCLAVLRIDSFEEDGRWVSDATLARCFLPVLPPPEGSGIEANLLFSLPREATNPGQFDPKEYLARGGVALKGVCRDAALAKLSSPKGVNPLPRYRAALRQRLLACAGSRGGMALAVLLGDRGLLEPEEMEVLVRSGLFHLVALSGLHVALLLVLLSGVAHGFGLHPALRDSAGIALALLYGLLAGPVPSMGRAVLMGLLFLLARLADRPSPGLWAWSLSLAGLLLYDPRWILDAGFQLTFAATFGILLLQPARPALPSWASKGEWLFKAVWMGFSAQLFTLPFLVYDFHRISLLGVLATPLAALPLFLVLGAGVPLLLGCAFVPGVATALGWLVARGLDLFLFLPHALGQGGAGAVFIPKPHPVWLLLFCLGIALLLARGKKRLVGWILLAATLVGAWAFPRFPGKPMPPGLAVLDVGQASCQVLLECDRCLLVDCGNGIWRGPTSARAVIEPFLAQVGLRSVSGVILTHWDEDHAGALPDLLADLPVGWVAYPAADPPNGETAKEIVARCKALGIPLLPLRPGDRFDSLGATWRILPSLPESHNPNENDRSLVARMETGKVSVLFTGDLEADGEAALVKARALSPVTALLVPHHGSKTSSTPAFLAAAPARWAFMSVGAHNRFGHPSPSVLASYRAAGVPLFRTDRDGALFLGFGREDAPPLRYLDGDWSLLEK